MKRAARFDYRKTRKALYLRSMFLRLGSWHAVARYVEGNLPDHELRKAGDKLKHWYQYHSTDLYDTPTDGDRWLDYASDISDNQIVRVAYWTDIHYGGHEDDESDPLAIELAALVTKDFSPTLFPTGMDLLDFGAYSAFADGIHTEDSLDALAGILDAHRGILDDVAPGAVRPYIMGNHDYRIFRSLQERPHEATTLARVFVGLVQDHLGAWYLGHNERQVRVKGLVLSHFSVSGQRPAATLMRRTLGNQVSALNGDCHRFDYLYTEGYDYPTIHATVGCLSRKTARWQNWPMGWQQGIAFATVQGQHVSIDLLPFREINGYLSTIWAGREYKVKLSRMFEVGNGTE